MSSREIKQNNDNGTDLMRSSSTNTSRAILLFLKNDIIHRFSSTTSGSSSSRRSQQLITWQKTQPIRRISDITMADFSSTFLAAAAEEERDTSCKTLYLSSLPTAAAGQRTGESSAVALIEEPYATSINQLTRWGQQDTLKDAAIVADRSIRPPLRRDSQLFVDQCWFEVSSLTSYSNDPFPETNHQQEPAKVCVELLKELDSVIMGFERQESTNTDIAVQLPTRRESMSSDSTRSHNGDDKNSQRFQSTTGRLYDDFNEMDTPLDLPTRRA